MSGSQQNDRRWAVYNIPISSGIIVQLSLPAAMTIQEWVQMFAVLEAMRPGIVIPELTADKPLEVTFKRYP